MIFSKKQKAILVSIISLLTFHAIAIAKSNPFAQPLFQLGSITTESSGLSPTQVRNVYGFSLFPLQGDGQVIGIVDAFDHPTIEADLAVFNTTFGLPPCTTDNGCFQKVYARGTLPPTDAGWAMQIAIDVEWAHAIAPKAKILLVEAKDDSFNELAQAARIAVKQGANVIALSWGAPEFSDENLFDRTFNVKGITFVAPSGNSGNSMIFYPAASPYVLSVGGTTLLTNSGGDYFHEEAWGNSSGGLSRFENALNYQINFPIPNNPTNARGVPDVSYNADPSIGYAVYNSVPLNNNSGWFVVGGTSTTSPQWAAIIAIANQLVGEGLNINTVLYRLSQATSYDANFNDVLIGRNGPCDIYCRTRAGYDYVTGLGTPKFASLVQTINQYYLSRIK